MKKKAEVAKSWKPVNLLKDLLSNSTLDRVRDEVTKLVMTHGSDTPIKIEFNGGPDETNNISLLIEVIDLKPCPFCGKEPTMEMERDYDHDNEYQIRCYNCGVKGDTSYDQQYLISTWNNRAQS